MNDPTYNRDEIKKKPEWELAFVISECINYKAPLEWSQYIHLATCLLANFDIKEKQFTSCVMGVKIYAYHARYIPRFAA